jgi:hypothetical protein
VIPLSRARCADVESGRNAALAGDREAPAGAKAGRFLRSRVRTAGDRLHLCHRPEDQTEDTVPRGDGQGARGREYDNEGQQFHRLSYRQAPQKLQHAQERHMTRNVGAIGGALVPTVILGAAAIALQDSGAGRTGGDAGPQQVPLFAPESALDANSAEQVDRGRSGSSLQPGWIFVTEAFITRNDIGEVDAGQRYYKYAFKGTGPATAAQ